MLYSHEVAFERCPECNSSQCHKHHFQWQHSCCGAVVTVKAVSISRNRIGMRCRACAHKRENMSDEYRQNLSTSLKGRELPSYTQERRERHSDSMRKSYAEGHRQPPKAHSSTYWLTY